jgi:hypothetical protein
MDYRSIKDLIRNRQLEYDKLQAESNIISSKQIELITGCIDLIHKVLKLNEGQLFTYRNREYKLLYISRRGNIYPLTSYWLNCISTDTGKKTKIQYHTCVGKIEPISN